MILYVTSRQRKNGCFLPVIVFVAAFVFSECVNGLDPVYVCPCRILSGSGLRQGAALWLATVSSDEHRAVNGYYMTRTR